MNFNDTRNTPFETKLCYLCLSYACTKFALYSAQFSFTKCFKPIIFHHAKRKNVGWMTDNNLYL